MFFWETLEEGPKWIRRTPQFAKMAGAELPEWYGELAGQMIARIPVVLDFARSCFSYPVSRDHLEDAKKLRNVASEAGIQIPDYIKDDLAKTESLFSMEDYVRY